jgi:hypothetical protein
MNATSTPTPHIQSLTALKQLISVFEMLDASAECVDADQFKLVAERLAEALRVAGASSAVRQLVRTSPAAAEIYENLQYEQAGLCLAPLDLATAYELKARQVIERARGEPAES